ncbi:MAG: hypothetical protein R3E87_26490 [Burkholderiaceae bacterium]
MKSACARIASLSSDAARRHRSWLVHGLSACVLAVALASAEAARERDFSLGSVRTDDGWQYSIVLSRGIATGEHAASGVGVQSRTGDQREQWHPPVPDSEADRRRSVVASAPGGWRVGVGAGAGRLVIERAANPAQGGAGGAAVRAVARPGTSSPQALLPSWLAGARIDRVLLLEDDEGRVLIAIGWLPLPPDSGRERMVRRAAVAGAPLRALPIDDRSIVGSREWGLWGATAAGELLLTGHPWERGTAWVLHLRLRG